MSFVPAPQQAIAASANVNNPAVKAPAGAAAAAAAAEPEVSDQELLFKLRTFDVYWVDKTALMYRDGIAKVRYATLRLLALDLNFKNVILWRMEHVSRCSVVILDISPAWIPDCIMAEGQSRWVLRVKELREGHC
jgi:hypothetical protein